MKGQLIKDLIILGLLLAVFAIAGQIEAQTDRQLQTERAAYGQAVNAYAAAVDAGGTHLEAMDAYEAAMKEALDG